MDNLPTNIEFTKRLGAGFFGGEGFILQRREGSGEVFIHSGGTIVPSTGLVLRQAQDERYANSRAHRD
jgi:uncharacterized protein (AIM24 family)